MNDKVGENRVNKLSATLVKRLRDDYGKVTNDKIMQGKINDFIEFLNKFTTVSTTEELGQLYTEYPKVLNNLPNKPDNIRVVRNKLQAAYDEIMGYIKLSPLKPMSASARATQGLESLCNGIVKEMQAELSKPEINKNLSNEEKSLINNVINVFRQYAKASTSNETEHLYNEYYTQLNKINIDLINENKVLGGLRNQLRQGFRDITDYLSGVRLPEAASPLPEAEAAQSSTPAVEQGEPISDKHKFYQNKSGYFEKLNKSSKLMDNVNIYVSFGESNNKYPIGTINNNQEFIPVNFSGAAQKDSLTEATEIFRDAKLKFAQPASNVVEPASNVVEPASNVVEPASNVVEPVKTPTKDYKRRLNNYIIQRMGDTKEYRGISLFQGSHKSRTAKLEAADILNKISNGERVDIKEYKSSAADIKGALKDKSLGKLAAEVAKDLNKNSIDELLENLPTSQSPMNR